MPSSPFADTPPPLRIAMFTPMPPARTGTADYAAQLIGELRKHVHLSIYEGPIAPAECARFDALVYQFANNGWHAPFCELARSRPGIAVLHETDLSYLCESSGLKDDRFLDSSKAFIVHSQHAAAQLRGRGLDAPVWIVPHGIRPSSSGRAEGRACAGANSDALVIGMFGFPGTHKNLVAGLRAFEELASHDPKAVLWMSGDCPVEPRPHPRLRHRVRYLGYQNPGEFEDSLSACDIVINLRRPPTNGETSGIAMRAFAAGLPVIVSDTGAFRELPGDVCFKIPCDRFEQSVLNACLLRLAEDATLRKNTGENARRWAEANCSWESVAAQYAAVIASACQGAQARHDWAHRLFESGDEYARVHFERFKRTLERTPAGRPGSAILEMGCTLHITPALSDVLGYSSIRGCALGPPGQSRVGSVDIDYFDAERDNFPYPENTFDTVLCCEVLEHLQIDPMQALCEINRVLKPGGSLVLSTPNAASFAALSALLHREHPGFYVSYQRPRPDLWMQPRHAREYSPSEAVRLLQGSGFDVESLETIPYGPAVQDFAAVRQIALTHGYPCDLRDACILAVARKQREPGERFPGWLYEG